jgi:hypothetical protein
VQKRTGEYMQISADAGYNDQIENQPNKITLIQFEKTVQSADMKNKEVANNKV